MKRRLEFHMIAPLRTLMRENLGLEVVTEEFSVGYGVADLVGAELSAENCRLRKELGIASPLDSFNTIELLLKLRLGFWHSLDSVLDQISYSESTLRGRVLPLLAALGLLDRDSGRYVRLRLQPPTPTRSITAIEAKQTRWREAILQARRYSLFAHQTYVAVWIDAARHVDRKLLYMTRVGLIAVEGDHAEVVVAAPYRKPRDERRSRYCAEYLYRRSLELQSNRGRTSIGHPS